MDCSSDCVVVNASRYVCKRWGLKACDEAFAREERWPLISPNGVEKLCSASFASPTPETKSAIDALKLTEMFASVISGPLLERRVRERCFQFGDARLALRLDFARLAISQCRGDKPMRRRVPPPLGLQRE